VCIGEYAATYWSPLCVHIRCYTAHMTSKHEAAFSIIAALLVLLSAMIEPSVSIIIATAALALMGGYQFTKK